MIRRAMVKKNHLLSICRQCALLSINRSGLYYQPQGESEENLKIMEILDKHILEEPTAGVLTMQSMLEDKHQIKASYERVRRLMRKANRYPIYPKKHLSVLGERKYIYPYLLSDLPVVRSNQVW